MRCPACATVRDKNRPNARQRGYTKQWQCEAKSFLGTHSFCRACGARAAVVDHVIPHKGNMDLFWDRTNWQPLCATCHNRKTVSQDGGFGR
ncbi:MAG: HNH endonuclease signature motif containing protein [Bdellovibrionales bacterium]